MYNEDILLSEISQGKRVTSTKGNYRIVYLEEEGGR